MVETEVNLPFVGEDANAIRQAMEQVQQASYCMSEQAYAGQPGSSGASGQEDVVEGEFRTV